VTKLQLVLFVLLVFTSTSTGQTTNQTTERNNSAPAASSSKPKPDADTEREYRVKRNQARSLLTALATDARTFNDPPLRARSLARIADALWAVDADQGRLLFRKAWEAAETADRESNEKLQEQIRVQKARTGGGYAVNSPTSIRREVLRLAARHDRALSEEFLEKMKAERKEAAETATKNRLPEALGQRISLAQELLRAGEVEQALQLADPVLSTITMEAINFLSYLREKDASAADLRLSALLASAGSSPQSDANTVSLLSSYFFTPHHFVTFTRSGTSSSSSGSSTPPEVSPELRANFFQVAANILLRQQTPGEQDPSAPGLDGKYYVMKRLLPYFEQFAPRDLIEAFRGQFEALTAVVSEEARKRDDDVMRRNPSSEETARDMEQSLLDRIERAKTSEQRDSLYIQLAMRLIGQADLRARDYVGKIEDPELRKRAAAYIDPSLANTLVGKKQFDQAIDLARKGELTRLQKSWVFIQCAKELAETDRERAAQLLDEATTEARRMDVSDPSLPRALLAVANAMRILDPARSWDATFDAVKAANSAEGFTGEDGMMVLTFQSKGQSSVHTSDVADFDVEGIFKKLANEDYDRAVELARGFQGEGPRAMATIAIARAVLERKPKAK
jgi:tetratricopeptide (TPR) repeat protein